MAKVHVKTSVEQNHKKHTFDGLGIMKDHRIVYYDDTIKTVLEIGDTIKIVRDTIDTAITLCFKPELQAHCNLKTNQLTLPMKIELSSIKQNKNKLEIYYRLEDEEFKFELEYEVLE